MVGEANWRRGPAERRAGGAEVGHSRILVVDCDPEGAHRVRHALSEAFEVHHAGALEEGLALAHQLSPDLIVSDHLLDGLGGVELLARAEQELPDTLRILMTPGFDPRLLMRAVNEAHVHHCVQKPFDAGELRGVIEGLLARQRVERDRGELITRLTRTVRDLDRANTMLTESEGHLQRLVVDRTAELNRVNAELQRASELLRRLAVRDLTTGLFNQHYLVEHLGMEVARAERYERRLAVVCLDIDGLERVNSRCGRAAGDRVLAATGRLLLSETGGARRSDFAARFDGDELCLVLPETDDAGAALKAERIRASFERTDWSHVIPGFDDLLTASAGVATYPGAAESAADLLEAADTALGSAKLSGRNRVVAVGARV